MTRAFLSTSVLAILAIFAAAAYATLTIPWGTLDGGGGRSTGGTLALTGTIGQFDAAAGGSSGGSLRLNGGFWVEAVPNNAPGAPALTITRQPNGSANIIWQSDAVGWQLQTSTELTGWSSVGGIIAAAGSINVMPTPAVPKRFYRLALP